MKATVWRSFFSLLSASLLSLFVFSTTVNAAPFEEGEQYEVVSPQQPTSTGDKIEVVEMFWYGCPHCYQFEPFVNRWLKTKPDNVEFIIMPAIFRPEWAIHARAFYTAQVLGVLDKVHSAIFEATHELKRPLTTEAQLADFFAEQGVKKEEFSKVFRSFAVESKVRRAMDMSRRYGIKGVPALIINGKYRTGGHMAGSNANAFKVVNYLIKKEAAKTN
ncbi:MAG: thiol:disulfide interchange protein DsbA/DsbL [Gammaproteobacteria bacterium]|nr:thiol:disulfide interchange protein DsbA/DsbL [Gammaproteobacteria bacterium]